MRAIIKIVSVTLAIAALCVPFVANAQDEAPKQVLFTNVNVFDGYADELAMDMNVLVENNLIKQVSEEPISAPGATVIDGGGRTLRLNTVNGSISLNRG